MDSQACERTFRGSKREIKTNNKVGGKKKEKRKDLRTKIVIDLDDIVKTLPMMNKGKRKTFRQSLKKGVPSSITSEKGSARSWSCIITGGEHSTLRPLFLEGKV